MVTKAATINWTEDATTYPKLSFMPGLERPLWGHRTWNKFFETIMPRTSCCHFPSNINLWRFLAFPFAGLRPKGKSVLRRRCNLSFPIWLAIQPVGLYVELRLENKISKPVKVCRKISLFMYQKNDLERKLVLATSSPVLYLDDFSSADHLR